MARVSLRSHIEALVRAERRRLDDLRQADKEHNTEYRTQALAQIHASAAADRERVALALEALNHQLRALNDLRKGVATSGELASVDKTVDETKSRVERIEAVGIGRAGGLKDYVGWIVAAVSVVAVVLSVVLRH